MSAPDTSRRTAAARLVHRAVVTRDPLDVAEHAALVDAPAAGAVVTFAGVVRDHDHGRGVLHLEYSAHPTAGEVLTEVVGGLVGDLAVDAVAVSHRVGPLVVGDVAFVVAVSAAHRGQAFEACSRLVDEVKARLPVWKQQFFDDGTSEWVACP